MKRFLVIWLVVCVVPLGAVFAASEDPEPTKEPKPAPAGPSCGLPYPVQQLLAFVADTAEFQGPASAVAQGRLGLALEQIELNDYATQVAEKLGGGAGDALNDLIESARALIRGELPPDRGVVIAFNTVLREAARAPCVDYVEKTVGDDESKPAEKERDGKDHVAGEDDAAHHAQSDGSDGDGDSAKADHGSEMSADKSHDDPSAHKDTDDPAKDAPTESHADHAENMTTPHFADERVSDAWVFALVAVGIAMLATRFAMFRFRTKVCRIPAQLHMGETPVYGFATHLHRKHVTVHSDIAATRAVFSGLAEQDPQDISLMLGAVQIDGKISALSEEEAKIVFEKPLRLKVFQNALAACLMKPKQVTITLPFMKTV